MKQPTLTPSVARLLGVLALTAGFACTAHAADAEPPATDAPGPYLGLSLGAGKLGPRHDGHDGNGGTHGDRPGTAKLYGGYRLTDTWGVEAGWVQLGRVHNDTTATDGTPVHHNGDAHSLYLAGTGRLALGYGFSLTGKAGVSLGRVSAKDSSDTDFTLGGSKASPLLGIGAEYKVNRHIALTFDLEGYGKVSDQVKASTATVGVRYGF